MLNGKIVKVMDRHVFFLQSNFLLPSLLWLFAGFDLVLLPLFGVELGMLYFPSYSPINSILAVYGTFSLSLLMRVFGGMYFGRLGDIHGRKAATMICSWFLAIVMIISAYLPSVYTDTTMSPTILFVITRILIGFFVGGLWPTAAILAMENLHSSNTVYYTSRWEEWKEGWEKWNNDFEKKVKRLTFQSSMLQVWLFVGYFLSAILVFFSGPMLADLRILNMIYLIPNDFPLWRTMCLIGGSAGLLLSFLCIKFLKESNEWKEWNEGWKKWKKKQRENGPELYKPGITSVLFILQNKKYREILFSFWLIMTGLMYMYYSTIITVPELFYRDSVAVSHSIIQQHFLLFLLLPMTFLAHIWVGFLCHIGWKKLDSSNGSSFTYKFLFSLRIILILKHVFHFISLKLLGIDDKFNKNNNKDDYLKDDLDVRLITNLGFVIILLGVFGFIYFVIVQPDSNTGLYAVIFTSIVILFANAAWAVIPSMLSSRFPIHLRSAGASLAYNGGLVIGFASPFIIMEFYLMIPKSECIIFVAMILGAVSMIVGGLRLMRIIKEYTPLPMRWYGPHEHY
jgi:MFS family permease